METNLCVAGFGGQGVMSLGKFLADATCSSTDKNVTFFPSYGAEQRGGTANCFVVISDEDIGAPLGDVMDDLIVMNGPSLAKFLPTLKKGGNLFINSSIVPDQIERDDVTLVKAPVTELALERGLHPGHRPRHRLEHHRAQAGLQAQAAPAEQAGLREGSRARQGAEGVKTKTHRTSSGKCGGCAAVYPVFTLCRQARR